MKTWVYQVKHGEVLEKVHSGKVNDEIFWISAEELLTSKFQFFVVLRDPLERLFSCYANKILPGRSAGPDNQFFTDGVFNAFHRYNEILEERRFFPDMKFDGFVKAIKELPDLFGDNHINSQVTFAPFYRKEFLKRCTIVLLPDLQEAIKDIFGEEVLQKTPLLHRMKSKAIFDREAVSEECLSQVQVRYKMDYALLKMLRSKNLLWTS